LQAPAAHEHESPHVQLAEQDFCCCFLGLCKTRTRQECQRRMLHSMTVCNEATRGRRHAQRARTHQLEQEHSSALHWHAPLAQVQSADVPFLQGQAMVMVGRCAGGCG
jgi:hypothetical protein